MAKFNTAVERANSSFLEKDEHKVNVLRRFGGKVVAVAGIIGVAAGVNMASANADEVVGFGGMGDPSGRAYENMLRATGQLGPNDTYHPVEYPASIWPLGPLTLQQSIDAAMPNGRAALEAAQRAAAPGEKVVIRGYSEGGIPAAILANERSGGGPVERGTVIVDGAPVSDLGAFNPQDPLVQSILPMATQMMGVPTHYRAPAGSIVRSSEQDVWAMGGPSDIGRLISQAMDTFMGPAHAVQDERGYHYVVVGADGVEHHIFPGTGTGGVAPGLGMGGVDPGAPAAAPVPNEQHPRWVPNSPNFEAQRRDVVEAPVTNSATNSVAQPVQRQNVSAPNLPKVERTERTVTRTNKETGRKTRVTSHVNIVARPGQGATRN